MKNYLPGNHVETEQEAKDYEDLFRLKELNGVYNSLIRAEGLGNFNFTIGKDCEHLYMDMKFKQDRDDKKQRYKISCRGYNPFCKLWGEQKPGVIEEYGHKFNEDETYASYAFGKPAVHWDRHSSIWNVYYGYITGDYSNLDVHTESIKEIAKLKGIELSEEDAKKLRTISKALTFRVFFGCGINNATNKFNQAIKRVGKDNEQDGDKDAVAAFEMAKQYKLAGTPEELIANYYKALENIGYIDEMFKTDATKDVTIFYIETCVYIFAALWLWNNHGIRTILKYDSFFLDLNGYIGNVDLLMEEAIFEGMEMYREWNLPGMHDELDCKNYLKKLYIQHVQQAKDSGEEVTYETLSEDLKDWNDIATPGEVLKAIGDRFSPKQHTRKGGELGRLNAKKSHAEKTMKHMLAIKDKMGRKEKLTNSDMAAKSVFKKNHPDQFKAIFG